MSHRDNTLNDDRLKCICTIKAHCRNSSGLTICLNLLFSTLFSTIFLLLSHFCCDEYPYAIRVSKILMICHGFLFITDHAGNQQ